MTSKIVDTFTTSIWVGFKDRTTDEVCSLGEVKRKIQEYVDLVGLCVSVTETEFIYTGGRERGINVGLINYPRFPNSQCAIAAHATALGEILLKYCKQSRVTIVMPNQTIMLSRSEEEIRDSI